MDLLEGRIKKQLYDDGDRFRVYATHAGEALRTLDRSRIPANASFRARGRWRPYRDSRTFVVEAFDHLVNSRGKPLRELARDGSAGPARVPEATAAGIAGWIGSSRIAGVGAATARAVLEAGEAIVAAMGEPETFAALAGVRGSRAEAICDAWARTVHAEAHAALVSIGVPYAVAAKVVRRHGDAAPAVVAADPWHMATSYPGIGFEACDRIAADVGASRTAAERVVAGLAQVLRAREDEGSTGIDGVTALEECSRLLGIPRKEASPMVAAAARHPSLSLEGRRAGPGGTTARILQTLAMRRREIAIAGALLRRTSRDGSGVDAEVEAAARARGMTLEPEQRDVVAAALTRATSIATGGPGTGKSSCMAVVVEAAARRGEAVLCMAPTGRAARRLGEATGIAATTVHRAIGRREGTNAPLHDAGNPLAADLAIVDEASMLDCALAAQLLAALGPGTRLLLVGDADQLASVGAGNVLGDAVASGVVPTTRLTRIHRQAEGSGIVAAARSIREGRAPSASHDVEILGAPTIEGIVAAVADVARRTGCRPDEVTVLTPTNGRPTGTLALNAALKAAFAYGPPVAEAVFEDASYGVGDKVMQVRNDYDREVFNGEVGRVVAADPATPSVTVAFPDGEATYEGREAKALRHAYALTVHKAQGSESEAVVLALADGERQVTRRLLYTAATRARRHLAIVASPAALARAAASTREAARTTGLVALLIEGSATRDLPNPF